MKLGKTRMEPGLSRTIPDEFRILAREIGTLQQWPTVLECLVDGSPRARTTHMADQIVEIESVPKKSRTNQIVSEEIE
jgi:hypothetical protein